MLKTTNVDLPLILLFLFTAALVNRRLNIGCLVRCLNIHTCTRLYASPADLYQTQSVYDCSWLYACPWLWQGEQGTVELGTITVLKQTNEQCT